MGLPLISIRHPTPGFDSTDDGLASSMNVDVLDGDLLLTAGPIAFQCLHLGREGQASSRAASFAAVLAVLGALGTLYLVLLWA
jgi:hypothetical protein